MAERFRVASRADVPPGTGKVVVAGGRVLALFNVEGEFFAVDNSCPHRGGPLGEGHLQGKIVTCPWHGWQFDLCTGVSPLNPRHTIRCVRLESEGDDLFACLD
ncbi:MAG TPA: Rieske 2Fe-2S domain-containing protein [Candidatus Polarisedimenticolia bacterium]|nr:Rieske 2Fe-2S domain-containing protein [Candidatus Polarisedimenticolia bacterium]